MTLLPQRCGTPESPFSPVELTAIIVLEPGSMAGGKREPNGSLCSAVIFYYITILQLRKGYFNEESEWLMPPA